MILRNKYLYLLVTVLLSAGFLTTAYAFVPNTNSLFVLYCGFGQGIASGGTNTYGFGTQVVYRSDLNYENTINNYGRVTNGLDGFGSLYHFGDGDYYQGYLYVPMEAAVIGGGPLGQTNVDIAVFNAISLSRYTTFSVSNQMLEASAICIDPQLSNSAALFASSFYPIPSSATNEIFEYSVTSLTNFTFVKALQLNKTINKIQGMVCVNGMIYVLCDNGPSGDVYMVNPSNSVVTYLAQLNVAGESEWEGLDYFKGFLVANEGGSGTINWYDFFGTQTNQNIVGFVKDNNGNPIIGVGVSGAATINGTNDQTAMVDTDTNGSYLLNVPNGNWIIAVNFNNGPDSLFNLGNYQPVSPTNVIVAGKTVTNNFIVQFASNQNIVGRVRDANGIPIVGVGVSGTATINGINYKTPMADTDTNGYYLLNVPSGIWTLTVNYNNGSDSLFSLGNYQPSNIKVITVGGSTVTNNFAIQLATGGSSSISLTQIPRLTISVSGNLIKVSWPAAATNCGLQRATHLTQPNWTTITDAAPGMELLFTNDVPAMYFRLQAQ